MELALQGRCSQEALASPAPCSGFPRTLLMMNGDGAELFIHIIALCPLGTKGTNI